MKTIFIQIPAYRDPWLLQTVNTAWETAKKSERISFGICIQDEEFFLNDFLEQCIVPKEQLNFHFIDWRETPGLGWARRTAQSYRGNSDYDLMIDSHMVFSQDWDVNIIKELNRCESSKPVLTTYCCNWLKETEKSMSEQEPFSIQNIGFGPEGDDMLYFAGSHLTTQEPSPLLHGCVSCHFMFTQSKFYKQCPYDPKTSFGYEECSIAVRGWTHGWDFFSPTKILVRHTWERHIRKLVWEDSWVKQESRNQIGWKRWRRLVGMLPNPLKSFGLGNERTLEEYEEFTGVNFKNKTVNRMAEDGYVLPQIHEEDDELSS